MGEDGPITIIRNNTSQLQQLRTLTISCWSKLMLSSLYRIMKSLPELEDLTAFKAGSRKVGLFYGDALPSLGKDEESSHIGFTQLRELRFRYTGADSITTFLTFRHGFEDTPKHLEWLLSRPMRPALPSRGGTTETGTVIGHCPASLWPFITSGRHSVLSRLVFC